MRGSSGTVLTHHSMVKLPEKPMMPRFFDERVGYFTQGFTDYGAEEHRSVAKRYITRYRLEKKDPNAAISEPVKPIVYYVDPATPTKWVPFIKKGIEDWQVAFEAAYLHGRLDRVICLDCRAGSSHDDLNDRLARANASWQATVTAVNPDGDADLGDDDLDGFTMVDCAACCGVLKRDVVYFGENVPVDRVAASIALVEEASALVVLGSSLTVFSGRRFVVRAARNGIPVAIVNDGPTRCDELATVRVGDRLGVALGQLLAQPTFRT